MTQCPAWRPGTRDIYSLQISTLVVSPRPPPTTFPTQSPVSVTPRQSATSQQAVSRDGKLTNQLLPSHFMHSTKSFKTTCHLRHSRALITTGWVEGAPLSPASPCDRCPYLLTCLVSSPRLVFWTMCEGLLATVYMPHRRRQQPSSDWAALLPTTHQTLHHGATQCCSAECDVLCTENIIQILSFYLVL